MTLALRTPSKPSRRTPSKRFKPGTTGWTASDLDDPVVEGKWFRGHYEIVEGVLTEMPPAYFTGGEALFNLMVLVDRHCKRHGPKGSFATEVDIIMEESRVGVADAAFLTVDERKRQDAAGRLAGKKDPRRSRILIPPTLIIETVSPGHELHDRHIKRRWYAEFGVRNYWVLDAFAHSLECLTLHGKDYRVDAQGKGRDILSPRAFPGLKIKLQKIWND
jgi:Uma2 family endonuclease